MTTMYWARRVHSFGNEFSRRRELALSLGYPQVVQLVPSNACNLRCSQCPKTWYDTDNRHLDPAVYRRVRDELFPYVSELNMQGLGEPTLSPLFWQMIEDAERYGLRVRFVSNASFMGGERIRRLVRAGVQLTISLDGGTAETHEQSRPGSSFAHLLKVFETFHEERQRQPHTGFALCLNTVVTSRNVGELEEILAIAGRSGIRHVTLINPGVGERGDEFAEAAIGRHPHLLAARLPRLRALASEWGFGLTHPGFLAEHEAGGAGPEASSSRPRGGRLFPGRCHDPWSTVYIDVDGWVRPCCRAIWIGMGNILQQPFQEIWNNEHYTRLRQSVNSNNPPSFCRNCPATWGINLGSEDHMGKLAAEGITLPPAPLIGVNAEEFPETR